MTDDPLLSRDQVAEHMGWQEANTVTRYLADTTRKVKRGEPLVGTDFPLPDRMFGRSPAWRLSRISAWQQTRPGQGSGAWSRRRSQPRRAHELQVHDIIQWEGRHLRVRARENGDPCVRLCVSTNQRADAEWVQIERMTWVQSYRPNARRTV